MLSLPEILENGVPPSIRTLITPETLVLLNKADLVPTSASRQGDLSNMRWETSVSEGWGMKQFMEGFTKALQERYVEPAPIFAVG